MTIQPDSFLITGTSSGIGLETARFLCGRGMRVFGSVREEPQATRLATELGPSFTPLLFDVRDEEAVATAAERVRAELGGRTLSGLVNNAGVAMPGPALIQPLSELREQIEVDLVGPMIVTRAFAPLLGTDRSLTGRPGRVVMISSIAGLVGQPFMSGYVAAKHGLEGFSEALRREVQLFGIEVVLIGPANVVTPIWEKAGSYAGRYAGTPYAEPFDTGVNALATAGETHGLDPVKVAEIVWTALSAEKPKTRYAPAQHPVVEQVLTRILPRRVLDFALGAALGLRSRR